MGRRRLNKDDGGRLVTVDWGEDGEHEAILLERIDKSTWSAFCGEERAVVEVTEKQVNTAEFGEKVI